MRTWTSSIAIICIACGAALLAQSGLAQDEQPVSAAKVGQVPVSKPASASKDAAPVAVLPEKAPAPRASTTNIRVEVTIVDQSGTGAPNRKTIGLTVVENGRGSVRSGVSIPIPVTTFSPVAQGGTAYNPMTSYNYRDMGLSLDVQSVSIVDNFVRLRIAVEYNPMDEKMPGADGTSSPTLTPTFPSFAKFSQTLEFVVENGKSLVVAQSSDPLPSRTRSANLEVKATILK